MKIIVSFMFFLLLGFTVYSQTWTVEYDGFDQEATIISKEQFDRIVQENETTAAAVSLDYFDAPTPDKSRVIKGTRPDLKGYYYMTVKIIPKNDDVEQFASLIHNMVIYGNTNTGRLAIIFYAVLLPETISLKYNWNEYTSQYNQLIKLVNGETQ